MIKQKIRAVICSECGVTALPTMTTWGMRHDCKSCGLHSWHGERLVDQETHDARQEAHGYFDPLWHFGRMSRSEAYRRLAAEMKISTRDCHVSRMTKEQARQVKSCVAAIMKREKEKDHAKP